MGPKGAGKSHIGGLARDHLGIPFVDVEALFLALPEAQRASYAPYSSIEDAVAESLERVDSVSLEITGASPHTAMLLAKLARATRCDSCA